MKRILSFQSAASVLLQRALPVLGLAAFALSGTTARAASPVFTTTLPRGGQAGAEVEVSFIGSRLADAEEILFHEAGFTVKSLEVVDDKTVKAVLAIAPDCRLGEHHVRVRCRSGMSYARNFWVSQFPNHDEVEPNDDFENPQIIPTNVTIEAEAKIEETDYYQVSAKRGERLSVEVEGLRINNINQQIAIDPFVAIFNKAGEELASADGSALLKQESVVSLEIPEDGDYIVEVRDSAYQGRGRYRAHIGNFPRPTAIFPAGGKPGEEVEFTLIGDVKGPYKTKVRLPEETLEGTHGVFAENGGLLPPSPNLVRVSPLENAFEVEPNNTNAEATDVGALPIAINGILEEDGDVDFFKFTAKKDQSFQIRVFANQLGTPVDPVLTVYNSQMRSLGSNDDADGTKDSRVDFKAPEDGEYYLRIQDMLKRGGPDFVYRIETVVPERTIEVTMPEMLRRDLQYFKQFDVPQGGYYAMVVTTTRRGVASDLKLDIPGLPKGVTVEAGIVPRAVGQFPILLKASPDAPIGGGFYDLVATTTEADPPVSGRFVQALDLVRGPQNGVEYYTRPFDKLPVSVVEPIPYSVTIEQPKVPIVRNGLIKLKIKAERKDDYDKKITVRFPWLPAGITSPATMTFNEKDTEIEYELNANENAALGDWNLTVLAESDSPTGKIVTASPFVTLSIEEPFLDIKLTMATAKQGETVAMQAEVEALRDFEGQADVQLYGLPAHATAEVAKLAAKAEALSIPVVTQENTPVGQHKGVFCTATVFREGQPILHRLSMGSVLRIDPKPKEAPPAAQAAAPAPTEKPLSRLEQLRLEAQKEGATP